MGLAVVDVRGAPGVPESRWVYATHDLYLTLPPPALQFLSAGVFTPSVRRFTVRALCAQCGDGDGDDDGGDGYNTTAVITALQPTTAALTEVLTLTLTQANPNPG